MSWRRYYILPVTVDSGQGHPCGSATGGSDRNRVRVAFYGKHFAPLISHRSIIGLHHDHVVERRPLQVHTHRTHAQTALWTGRKAVNCNKVVYICVCIIYTLNSLFGVRGCNEPAAATATVGTGETEDV